MSGKKAYRILAHVYINVEADSQQEAKKLAGELLLDVSVQERPGASVGDTELTDEWDSDACVDCGAEGDLNDAGCCAECDPPDPSEVA